MKSRQPYRIQYFYGKPDWMPWWLAHRLFNGITRYLYKIRIYDSADKYKAFMVGRNRTSIVPGGKVNEERERELGNIT